MKKRCSLLLAFLLLMQAVPTVFANDGGGDVQETPPNESESEYSTPTILWDFNADGEMSAVMEGAQALSYSGTTVDDVECYEFIAEGEDPFIRVNTSADDVSDIVWAKARVKNPGSATAIELFGATNGRDLSGPECTHIDILSENGGWYTYLINIPEENVRTINEQMDNMGDITSTVWEGTVDWIRLDPMWKEGDSQNTHGNMEAGEKIYIDYVAFFPSREEAVAFRSEEDNYAFPEQAGLLPDSWGEPIWGGTFGSNETYPSAFDGDPETYFESSDSLLPEEYVGVETTYKTPYNIAEVRFFPRQDAESVQLDGMVVQGSTDFEQWEDLLILKDTEYVDGKWYSLRTDNEEIRTGFTDRLYPYFRLVQTESGVPLDVAEVEFYGNRIGEPHAWLGMDCAGNYFGDIAEYATAFDCDHESTVLLNTEDTLGVSLESAHLHSILSQVHVFVQDVNPDELDIAVEGKNPGGDWERLDHGGEFRDGRYLYFEFWDNRTYSEFRIVNHGDPVTIAEVEFYGYVTQIIDLEPTGAYPVSGTEGSLLPVGTLFGTEADDYNSRFSRAFDGDMTTAYDAADMAGDNRPFVGMTVRDDQKAVLDKVVLYPRQPDENGEGATILNGITVQGSNNGVDWDTLSVLRDAAFDAGAWYTLTPSSDKKIYIDRQSAWDYIIQQDRETVPGEWTTSGEGAEVEWTRGIAPFGDCVIDGIEANTPWEESEEADNNAIFLRKTFWVDNAEAVQNADLRALIAYDDNIEIYLNGNLIYTDENWVITYTDLDLNEAKQYLNKGENILAVSLCNSFGGRTFDMSLYANGVSGKYNEKYAYYRIVSEDRLCLAEVEFYGTLTNEYATVEYPSWAYPTSPDDNGHEGFLAVDVHLSEGYLPEGMEAYPEMEITANNGQTYGSLEEAVEGLGKSRIAPYTFISGTSGFDNEDASLLWDGDTGSKFCSASNENVSIAALDGMYRIDGIFLATANDSAECERNPAQWAIFGSADGENWTPIAYGDNTFFGQTDATYYAAALAETEEAYHYIKFQCGYGNEEKFQLSEVALSGERVGDYDKNPADAAFDGNRSSVYDAALGGREQNITMEVSDANYARLTEIRFYPVQGRANRIAGLTVQGSMDGEHWEDIVRQYGDQQYRMDEWFTVCPNVEETQGKFYRYFRLVNPIDHLNIAELELYGETRSTFYPSSGYEGDAELLNDSIIHSDFVEGYAPDLAFDGLADTYFSATGGNTNEYIGIQLDNDDRALIKEVWVLACQAGSPYLDGLRVQGSNDNQTWEDVLVLGEMEYNPSEWCVLTSDSNGTENTGKAYAYFRLNKTADEQLNIAEVEFYGERVDDNDSDDGSTPTLLWDFNTDEEMSKVMGEQGSVFFHGADVDGVNCYEFTAQNSDPCVDVKTSMDNVEDILWAKARVKNPSSATAIELFALSGEQEDLSGESCTHINILSENDGWYTYLINIPAENLRTVNTYGGSEMTEFYWTSPVHFLRFDPMWKIGDDGLDTSGGNMKNGDTIYIDYIAFFPSREEALAFRTDGDNYAFQEQGMESNYPSSGYEGDAELLDDRIIHSDFVEGYAPDYAFDGISETYFSATGGYTEEYIGIQLDNDDRALIREVRVLACQAGSPYLDGLRVQGSNDNQTWEDVLVLDAMGYNPSEWCVLTSDSNGTENTGKAYAYFRLNKTADEQLNIAEVEFYGERVDNGGEGGGDEGGGDEGDNDPIRYLTGDLIGANASNENAGNVFDNKDGTLYMMENSENIGIDIGSVHHQKAVVTRLELRLENYENKKISFEVWGGNDRVPEVPGPWTRLDNSHIENPEPGFYILFCEVETAFTNFYVANAGDGVEVAEARLFGIVNEILEPGYSGEYPASGENGTLLPATTFGTRGWSTENRYSKAFDGNLDTYYDSEGGFPHNCAFVGIAVEGGKKATLDKVIIYPRQDEWHRLNGMAISASNDGVQWTDIAWMPADTDYVKGQQYTLTPNTDTPYAYFRLVNNEDHLNVAEIEFHGTVTDDAAEALYPSVGYPASIDDNGHSGLITGEAFGFNAYAEGSEYDKAFDGDLTTKYDAAVVENNNYAGLEQFVGIRNCELTILEEIRLYPVQGECYRMEGMTLQGSNDGEVWDTLFVMPEEELEFVIDEWYTFGVDVRKAYTQFRLVNPQDHLNVVELELYGRAPSGYDEWEYYFKERYGGYILTNHFFDKNDIPTEIVIPEEINGWPVVGIRRETFDELMERILEINENLDEGESPVTCDIRMTSVYLLDVFEARDQIYHNGNNYLTLEYAEDDSCIVTKYNNVKYFLKDGKAAVIAYDSEAIDADGTLTIPATVWYNEREYTVVTLGAMSLVSYNHYPDDGRFYGDDLATFKNLVLPETITHIGAYAIHQQNSMTSLTLSDALEIVWYSAINQNKALEEIRGLASIDKWDEDASRRYYLYEYGGASGIVDAWEGRFMSYTLGAATASFVLEHPAITCVEEYAFYEADNLRIMTVGEGIHSLSTWSFGYCDNLQTLYLPSTMEWFGAAVVQGSNNLIEISLNPKNEILVNHNGTIYRKLYDDNGEYRGLSLELYPYGSTSFDIPSDIGVVELNVSVLEHCSTFTELHIPEGVEEIRDFTFASNPNVTKITLPSTLKKIYQYAFGVYDGEKHMKLKSMTIPAGLEFLSRKAFEDAENAYEDGAFLLIFEGTTPPEITDLDSFYNMDNNDHLMIICPNGTSDAYKEAFVGTLVSSAELIVEMQEYEVGINDKNLAEYGLHVENGVLLAYDGIRKNLDLSKTGITAIGDYVFMDSGVSTIILPDTVTSIGCQAFECCPAVDEDFIASLVNVTEIGWGAFGGCWNVKELIIPTQITEITDYMFGDMYDVETLTIHAGVERIEHNAFSHMESLKKIIVEDGNTVFTTDEQGALYEKDGDGNLIRLIAAPTNNGATTFVIPETVRELDPFALYSYETLEGTFTIPAGVTDIGDYALSYLREVDRFAVGSGNHTFYTDVSGVLYRTLEEEGNIQQELMYYPMARAIPEYTVRAGTTVLGKDSFTNANLLEKLSIPDSVTKIDDFALQDCPALREVNIPASLEEIGGSAFIRCAALVSITLPEAVTVVQAGTFYECENLIYVGMPGVLDICEEAFYGCKNLTKVDVPKVRNIMEDAFAECSQLSGALFETTDAPQIAKRAFFGADGIVLYCLAESKWDDVAWISEDVGSLTCVMEDESESCYNVKTYSKEVLTQANTESDITVTLQPDTVGDVTKVTVTSVKKETTEAATSEYEFTMTDSDSTQITEFDKPVFIKLPLEEGMNKDKLVIYHDHNKGTEKITEYFFTEENGVTYVNFRLYGFSTVRLQNRVQIQILGDVNGDGFVDYTDAVEHYKTYDDAETALELFQHSILPNLYSNPIKETIED